MPNAPKRHNGRQVKRQPTRRRIEMQRMYNSKLWRGPGGARLTQLEKQPLCETCLARGEIRAATEVDHKRAHNGNMELFLDPENLNSACISCHSRKTATTDHGFGNV